jgi:endonuclease/exonuclease/phosphatase family metal-dependent hydrolase
MIRLACLNLNKRANNKVTRTRILKWLNDNYIDFFAAQEPWQKVGIDLEEFSDWTPLGGNRRVFSWIRSTYESPSIHNIEDFLQRIEIGYLVLYNTYLSAYEQEDRAEQIKIISEVLRKEEDRPILLIGDFNIAPRPEDGISNGRPSNFNSATDREPLEFMIEEIHLEDLAVRAEKKDWTIERTVRGKLIQFRCDLALASDYISNELPITQDNSVRHGPEEFTDHSALIIDLPVTLPECEDQFTLFPREISHSIPIDAFHFKPEKTAIHRKEPTPIAREIVKNLKDRIHIRNILDYGCGYGRDVEFYQSKGIIAEGYDPHPPFGWSKLPTERFDIVTLVFVLNVLPDPWSRFKVLMKASEYVAENGILIVVSRTEREINRYATTKGWPSFNDGYWSHEGKGTFQRGLCVDDILRLARRCSFTQSPQNEFIKVSSDTTIVTLHRGLQH